MKLEVTELEIRLIKKLLKKELTHVKTEVKMVKIFDLQNKLEQVKKNDCIADVSGCFSDKIKGYRKVHGSCDDCQVVKWDKKGYCEYFHKTKECKESSYIYIK